MSRRSIEPEGEKGNSERWLLTYSDMITLLLALFIIMYGMSSVDSQKMKEMSRGLEQVLNHSGPAAGTGANARGLCFSKQSGKGI
ncbi:flagellar motor protein MotB [Lachnospiraceae bacterium 54-53]